MGRLQLIASCSEQSIPDQEPPRHLEFLRNVFSQTYTILAEVGLCICSLQFRKPSRWFWSLLKLDSWVCKENEVKHRSASGMYHEMQLCINLKTKSGSVW